MRPGNAQHRPASHALLEGALLARSEPAHDGHGCFFNRNPISQPARSRIPSRRWGRATSVWGVEEGSVRSLWKRKALTYVKAHIMDRLRQIDDVLEEYANRQRKALEETAQVLEERGSRAAGLARFAAQMAREEAEG